MPRLPPPRHSPPLRRGAPIVFATIIFATLKPAAMMPLFALLPLRRHAAFRR
jgi:hypothetical protein